MSPVAFPIVCGVALAVFVVLCGWRARLLLAARPAGRLDRPTERIRRAAVYGLGQKKFLGGEQPAGIMHALIFWGFVVLMLQVITLFARAYDASWDIPGLGPDQLLGPAFSVARYVLEVEQLRRDRRLDPRGIGPQDGRIEHCLLYTSPSPRDS